MLKKIFKELEYRGLCQTQKAFATDWLGVVPGYLAAMKGEPSNEVHMRLYRNLCARGVSDLAAELHEKVFGAVGKPKGAACA